MEAWLGRIALEGIEYVVLRDGPMEHRWMGERPDRFWLRVDDEQMKVYRVLGRPR
jgi:hypothetical protein